MTHENRQPHTNLFPNTREILSHLLRAWIHFGMIGARRGGPIFSRYEMMEWKKTTNKTDKKLRDISWTERRDGSSRQDCAMHHDGHPAVPFKAGPQPVMRWLPTSSSSSFLSVCQSISRGWKCCVRRVKWLTRLGGAPFPTPVVPSPTQEERRETNRSNGD